MKSHIFHILTICSLLLTVTACDEATQAPIRIAHVSWPGYEPLPLAESEDLYHDVQVMNYRVGSATEVIRAFEQNIVEVAAVTLDEAIVLQSRSKQPIYIIAVLDISDGGDAIIAKKEIASVSDLKGKRIGLESSALGAFFISRAVDSAPNLSLEQMTIVPILYDHHFTSFISGDIDAIVTFEPIKSMILKSHGHVIFDSRAIKNEIVDVLITKQLVIEKRADEIKALITGYFRALEFIEKHPNKSLLKMAKFEDVSVSSFRQSLSGIRIPDITENHVLLSGDSPALTATINKLQDFLNKNTIIESDLDIPMVVTGEFLPEQGRIGNE